jgi:hypothetical protein
MICSISTPTQHGVCPCIPNLKDLSRDSRKEKTLNLNFHQDLFGDFYALMMVAADAFMLMPLTSFQRLPWNPKMDLIVFEVALITILRL